jgi:hypothetical protein
MPIEPSPAAPGPEEFDRQLREITSGTAGAARFRELSAAERAKLSGGRPRLPKALRKRLLARKLRKPAPARPPKRPSSARARRRPLRVVGGRGHNAAQRTRRQRLLSVAKAAGIVAGFVALLVVLHLLGLGPQ